MNMITASPDKPGDSQQNEALQGTGDVLAKFGATPKNITEAMCRARRTSTTRNGTHRQTHIDDIRKYATEIIAENGGNPLVSAEQVRQVLVKYGCARTLHGLPMKEGRGLGDALGLHGLCLPVVQCGGTRLYLLSAANATEAEIKKIKEALFNGEAHNSAGTSSCDPTETAARSALSDGVDANSDAVTVESQDDSKSAGGGGPPKELVAPHAALSNAIV